MRDFQIIMMVFAAMLSVIPVVELYHQKKEHRFPYLSVMMTLVFLWSLNMLIKHMISDLTVAYYLHLILFSLIYLLTYYLLRTIYGYIEQSPPKWLHPLAIIIFIIHLSISLTNEIHQWMLPFGAADIVDQSQLMETHMGPIFLIHVLLSYGLVLFSVIKFLQYYRHIPYKRQYKAPFVFFTLTIVIALILNVLHLYVARFYIDPTYFSVVIFSYGLYHFIYRRDFYYALLQKGRKDVLNSMRESYILTDETGRIIEASDKLKAKYNLNKISFVQDAMLKLKSKVVLYEDIDEVKDKHLNKAYYYTVKKTFDLDRFDVQGYLHLFYDETKFVQLIAELEKTKDYDVMTGLYNRNFLENAVETLEDTYPSFGIMIMDINGLKFFNDHFGHRKGDDLIMRFVEQLKVVNDEKHWLIRSGGDEFVMIVKEANDKLLASYQARLLERCHDPDPLKEISIAVGYHVREQSNTKFETVYKAADDALYRMKKETSEAYKTRLKDRMNIKEKSSN